MTDPRTRVAVVVGNPKPRQPHAGGRRYLARELAGEPDLVVDLADLGAGAARLGRRRRGRPGRAGR